MMLRTVGRGFELLRRAERASLRALVLHQYPHLRGLEWDPRTSTIDYAQLQVGRNCSLGAYAYLYGPVVLHDDVMIARNCALSAGAHRSDLRDVPIREQGGLAPAGIVIETDVWLAHGVIVLDGVRIGQGSVIGAGSVVTRDIPPYTLAAGNPCQPLRGRFEG